MSRFASLSLNVLLIFVAIVAIAAPRDDVSADARPEQAIDGDLAQIGAAEMNFGNFSGFRIGTNEPVAFIWSYDDNGTQVEVWALFRPNTPAGWTFPGTDATSVDLSIEYQGSPTHASPAEFLQWCEDQYPASMNVDKDNDFEVHRHTIEILQS